MKIFSGFPNGKLQVTPLPDLFFSELVPAIDDLAELKLTLHLFWLLAHPARRAVGDERKGRALYVTENELRADRTLMQSLAAAGDPGEALAGALAKATERGTLLRLIVHLDTGDTDLYFVNSEAGRRACDRFERGQEAVVSRPDMAEPAAVSDRPDIFNLYEKNVGLLTPMLAEQLKDAEGEYPAEWIADAFKIAVDNNKRSWSYIRSILERWKVDGRTDTSKKGKTWYGNEYGKFVKR